MVIAFSVLGESFLMSQVVVFDLDGTLVDAFADIAVAVNAPLVKRGFPAYGVDVIRSMVGDGTGMLLQRATPEELMDDFDVIKEEMHAQYLAHPATLATVYDGIFPVLEALKARGVKMAALTNKPHAMTLKTCDEMGLTPYLDEMIGENAPLVPRKPDPGGLLGILERLGATSSCMVGDGKPDGEVALNAKVPFVACLWGTKIREELAVYNPVTWAETPDDLTEAILGALG